MLKISLLFKKFTNFKGVDNSRIVRIKNLIKKFQGIVFIWTQTYSEIFKSALEYLHSSIFNENFMKQVFFSILQLTFNIRQIKKLYLKILENHQDFAFFVDPFKFKLYEN